MTSTQIAILAALTDQYQTPAEIGKAIGLGYNPGAAARSLRFLLSRGLVEQKQVGWFKKRSGIGLYAYRKIQE